MDDTGIRCDFLFMKKKQSFLANFPVWIWFVGITVLSRLPYFFDAHIEWDEHTFFLLGQSVLDGYLPYTGPVLDIKTPFLWYVFAGLIFGSFKTFFGVRFLGAIIVGISGYIAYLCLSKVWDKYSGIVGGLTLIIMVNLSAGGQAVISEHLVLIPLLLTFYIFLVYIESPILLYFAGILITSGAMIRLNLSYTVMVLGLYLVAFVLCNQSLDLKKKVINVSCYTLGCLSVFVILALPYLFTNNLESLYIGVIRVPLAYSQEQSSYLDVFKSQLTYILLGITLTSIAFAIVHSFVLFCAVLNLLKKTSDWKSLTTIEQRLYQLALLFFLSIEMSIIKSGIFYGHYQIQLVIFMALLSAPTITKALRQSKKRLLKNTVYVCLGAFLIHTSIKTISDFDILFETGNMFHGKSFQVAEVLSAENPNKEPMWLTNSHLAHWLTGTYPVIPSVTHPSNIARRDFFIQAWYGDNASSLTELEKIIAIKPLIIVGDNLPTLFSGDRATQQILDTFVGENYTPLDLNRKYLSTKIFKRNA